jgi:cytochrome d ubiquinol oxidase subunit I
MVAAGTLISTFWILAANSWMQTPAGYRIVDGRFFPTDWVAVIFNPSFPYRFAHTVVAFYVTTAFVVVGVGAWYLRRGRFPEEGRAMMSMSLWLLTVLVPLQIFLGDQHGLNTLQYQPEKIAAIEANWQTRSRMPLTLFAIPDQAAAMNHYAIELPDVGSLILTHDPDGTVPGLKDWPADTWPTVAIPFFAFRIMVGIGLLLLAIVVAGWWLRWRGRLFTARPYLFVCQCATPLGFLAVLAGWITTETGRQPWTVYGLLRTAQSVSPSLTGRDVLISLLGYVAVYLVMYPAGVAMMARLVRRGPQEPGNEPVESGRPERPVHALPGPPAGLPR